MKDLSLNAIEKLLKESTQLKIRVSEDAKSRLRDYLEAEVIRLGKTATMVVVHGHRKTIKTKDINMAINMKGE